MVLSLPVLALLACSALACAVALGTAGVAAPLVVSWNPEDAGAAQLARERRAVLVESAAATVFAVQLVGVVLFVATAERLHPLLPGAMCAAGTFQASRFGYPALALELLALVLCGLWLVTHRATRTAASTALVRFKLLFLIVVAVVLAAAATIQVRFVFDLDPAILTSCCATIFDARTEGAGWRLGARLAALPVPVVRTAFFAALGATLVVGVRARVLHRSPVLFSLLTLLLGAVSIAALVAWVAPSVYELPTHHCPFCLLASEHAFVGYPLYAALAVAVVAGAGSGLVRLLRSLDRWRAIGPAQERRLCAVSMTGFSVFTLMAVSPTVVTTLRLLRAGGS